MLRPFLCLFFRGEVEGVESGTACSRPRRLLQKLCGFLDFAKPASGGGIVQGASALPPPRGQRPGAQWALHRGGLAARGPAFRLQRWKRSVHGEVAGRLAFGSGERDALRERRAGPRRTTLGLSLYSLGRLTSCHLASQESSGIK